ncbi:MAG: GNAT family N-acetyltransferase [Microthrixaceae bacterium]
MAADPTRWHPTAVPPAQQGPWMQAAAVGFGYTRPSSQLAAGDIERLGRRAWAVRDGDRIVGTSADLTWALTLPGGAAVPVGAITTVTTRASHRRRGVLTAMMGAQLGALRDEGAAAAVLTASEGGIYGRFGFGVACSTNRIEAPTYASGLAHPVGDITLDVASELRDDMVSFRRQVAAARPGTLERPEAWWDLLVLGPQETFEGGGDLFASVHRNEGGSVDGYALWRLGGQWGTRVVNVRELHTLDPAVELALFRHCAELDLSETVSWNTAPPDTPIPAATADPRRCRVTERRDQLWLCPIDPAGLLAARSYAAPLDVTLSIEGVTTGWSAPPLTVRVSAQPGDAATVVVLDERPGGVAAPSPGRPPPAELTCDRAALGMALLGTTSWRTLAAAGRARAVDPSVLAAADAAFASHPAANSQDYF